MITRRWTREQTRNLDRHAVATWGVPEVLLMENAARGAAEAILRQWPQARQALVLCGGGNNGGDGYAIARHLLLAEVAVTIVAAVEPARLSGAAATMANIAQKLGITIVAGGAQEDMAAVAVQLVQAQVVVDALVGTGFTGAMRPQIARLITAVNALHAQGKLPVAAVDVPSGLDADTGRPADPTIVADLTITFVAQKAGFASMQAWPHLGQVAVCSIGVPARMVE